MAHYIGEMEILPSMNTSNPLLADWTAPFGVPPLDQIKPEHFQPAFEQALVVHRREIAAIADDKAAPDFDNTVAALERSGRSLARVSSVGRIGSPSSL